MQKYLSQVLMVLFLLLFACRSLAQPVKADPTWLPEPERSIFADDLDRASLQLALQRSLDYLRRSPAKQKLPFGDRRIAAGALHDTLKAFQGLLSQALTPEALQMALYEQFEMYQASGRDGHGRVLFTGYYDIRVEGSLQPSATYVYPLYRPPPDLQRPYLTRHEIDVEGKLRGRQLELAWLRDPVEGFFLHVQGSGQVHLPGGEILYVGYADSNGHPYRSIGRLLVKEGRLDLATLSLQRLRRYLREHPEDRQRVLSTNPRYIFFRQVPQGPRGSLQVGLVPGRSIATDARLFPPAGLAIIQTQKPAFNAQGEIISWRPFSRVVFNHDTGSALTGPGRVDLFWGSGTAAETAAGHMRHPGRLFFLLKR